MVYRFGWIIDFKFKFKRSESSHAVGLSNLNTESYYYRRCIWEALEIQKEEVGPNGDKIINK